VGDGWRVKYDGVCSKCGTPLLRGVPAVYNRRSNTISCVECPPKASEAALEPVAIDAGIAGGSARREHDRRAAKREAELKGRWGDRIGGWIVRLTDEPQSTRAWAIGARGEEKLAEALAAIPGLQVLNDRAVRGTQGNIDHIVIGPAGVFVVDAKHIEGLIHIENVGPFWRSEPRLYVGRRDKSELAFAMEWQVTAVRDALVAAGIDPLPPITPVLCFVDGRWPFFRPPDEFAGVRLESELSIVDILRGTQLFEAAEIEALARVLAEALPAKRGRTYP
jgi:hypothetical protein